MDAAAQAEFDSLKSTMQQLVTVIQGVPKGTANPYGLVGTHDLASKIDALSVRLSALEAKK